MIFSILIYQDMYTEIQIRIKPEQAGVEEHCGKSLPGLQESVQNGSAG